MKNLFCNNCNLSEEIPQLIADELLGVENLSQLKGRYQQMKEGYDFSYEQWQSLFTEELKPFRGYTDTTGIMLPIKHPKFKTDFEQLGKGAIGVDLPTWFNIQNNNPRIMLIAQDPLRSNKWYGECKDAVLSSPFGLHDATHRDSPKGGKMVNEFIHRLVSAGNAVYLTDARKYFIYDHKTSDKYADTRKQDYLSILKKEIEIVKPKLCVCLGNRASSIMYDIATNNGELQISCISLPHLSGAARGAIVKRYPLLLERKATATNIAEQYANEIIGCLTTNS
ncbi:MAG: hypothetical protein UHD64_00140 [Bacteroidales bacterium]|nr:hypothetical protein [Bacteroidales bacterium]